MPRGLTWKSTCGDTRARGPWCYFSTLLAFFCSFQSSVHCLACDSFVVLLAFFRLCSFLGGLPKSSAGDFFSQSGPPVWRLDVALPGAAYFSVAAGGMADVLHFLKRFLDCSRATDLETLRGGGMEPEDWKPAGTSQADIYMCFFGGIFA